VKTFLQVMGGVMVGTGATLALTVSFSAAVGVVALIGIWTGTCCAAQVVGEVLR
jgi:hypothetical protein